MADTYSKVLVHCVFSTKERRPCIPDPPSLWSYVRGVARNLGVDAVAVGGTDNHVHLLLRIPPTVTVAGVIRAVKANSSRHLREQGLRFAWQDGYSAISVSPSQVRPVANYVQRQPQHHAHRSFEDEYTGILRKSAVAFDAQYVFG